MTVGAEFSQSSSAVVLISDDQQLGARIAAVAREHRVDLVQLSPGNADAVERALRGHPAGLLVDADAHPKPQWQHLSVPSVILARTDGDALAAADVDDGVLFLDETSARIGDALDRILAQRGPALADRGKADPSLAEISAEVMRIARRLNALAGTPQDEAPQSAVSAPQGSSAQVRALLRARRAREHYFGADIFADPAWDILLDLTAARLDGERVSVSSLCIAAAVPTTTALRCINNLVTQGLLVRRPDPQDGRREFVDLAEATFERMQIYLATVGGTPVV